MNLCLVVSTLLTTSAAFEASPKQRVVALCAAADRGFASSRAERAEIEAAIDELCTQNPTENPAQNLALRRCWKLIYTSAPDVSTLNANPLVAVGAVYQDARDWPTIVNVIDSTPRISSLAPAAIQADTATRLRVVTRAEPRSPTRVGLTFERAEVQPLSLLGFSLPFPALGLDLPQASSYFEVRFLDDDVLVIEQASPGGIFASVAVDEITTNSNR